MLVFTTTVMNMENGRCEMTFSMPSPDFLNAFAQWFALFCAVVSSYLTFCINNLTVLEWCCFYTLYVLWNWDFQISNFFGAKLIGKRAKQKYITKQHYKQQKNNINNVVLFITFFIIVSYKLFCLFFCCSMLWSFQSSLSSKLILFY